MARKKIKDVKVEEVKIEVTKVEEKEIDRKPKKITKVEEIEPTVVINKEEIEKKLIETEKEEQTEKKRKFFDEVKSFFIIILIIGAVALGCYLFVKYAEPINWGKNKDDGFKTQDTELYKTALYKTEIEDGYLKVINDKYLIEYTKENYIRKIMSLDLEVLYEDDEDTEVYEVIEGIDNQLYLYTYSESDDAGILILYVLENEKIVEVKEFATEGIYYDLVIYDNYLVGVSSNESYMDEELNDIVKSTIYTLNNNEYTIDDYLIVGDDSQIVEGMPSIVYTNDSRYIIISKNNLYGLYDLVEGKIVIKATYNDLYTGVNGEYVAIKDGKTGIINKKLKKIVDFNYDFIDINYGYYIVSKSGKLALMNEEHKLITGYDFKYLGDKPYSYGRGVASKDNSFMSFNYYDYYVLVNGVGNYVNGLNYKSKELHVISKDGTYRTVKSDMFTNDLYYSYDEKNDTFVIYGYDLEERYKINLSDYDYDDYPEIKLINNNVIVIKLDSELYYDYETGEELAELKDVTYHMIGLQINYVAKENKVNVIRDNKVIATYSYNALDDYYSSMFNTITDSAIYYCNGKNYVMVKKR